MEQEKQAFFPKLMSILFIAMGIFLGFYAFFANATTWTLPGGATWDNNNYLTGLFRDNNPTTGDIITALYGSGDTGSVYTQNRTGYSSGSCLNGGMNVEFTGMIPTSITNNTIYIIASGTYTVTTPITMNDCSALITSGIVVLSGNIGNNSTIISSGKQHIIIEKIKITNNASGGSVYVTGGKNICMNEIKTYATNEGTVFNNTSYAKIRNLDTYDNTLAGFTINNSTNISVDTINTHNNQHGIWIFSSSGIVFTGITSYDNSSHGIVLFASLFTTLNSGIVYNNTSQGIVLNVSDNNTLTTIDAHTNIGHNIYLDQSSHNTFNNVIANGSQTSMGINLYDSHNNILSGITTNGNYYAGIHLYNSSYNTGISITANSNEGGLYMENSSHNIFTTTTINNSLKNGIVVSGSNYTIFSGLVSSGNHGYGAYWQSSNNTTIAYSSLYGNTIGGIFVISGDNSTIQNSEIYNNTGAGISFVSSSGVTLDTLSIHDMLNFGAGIDMVSCMHSTIFNSILSNNWVGISFLYGNSNIISGTHLTGTTFIYGITLRETSNNTIYNSNVTGGGSQLYASIHFLGGTGNSVSLFSGVAPILGAINSVYIYNNDINNPAYAFDSYTKTNNYIYFTFVPYASLSGNSISLGSSFTNDFDLIEVGVLNTTILSGVSSFTVSGATWNGKIYPPTKITAGSKLCTTGEVGTTNISQFLDTIEVVSGSTYLTMNGGTGTINFRILSGYSGQYLTIVKSIDGTTWTGNILTSGCILNTNLDCSFTTTGNIKLFGFGIPTNYSFTGVTQTGLTIISGGYYTTGIRIYFTGDNLSGATLSGNTYTSGTLITGDAYYTFMLSDLGGNTTGTTFIIDTTNPAVTSTAPISGTTISTTNNIIFTWTGLDANMSGYTVFITGTQIQTLTTTGTNITGTFGNGTYTRYVIATDRAGNTGVSVPATFIVTTPLLPTMTLLTGNLQSNTMGRYTKDTVSISLQTNKAANYSFTGNFTTPTPPFIGTGLNGVMTGTFSLTTGDGQKNIYLSVTDGFTTSGKTFTLYLDTTAPGIPALISPTSGSTTNGAFTISWSATSDTGIGLSGYQYFVSTTGTIGTGIVSSGYTTSTSKSFTNGEIGTSGTFYRYVRSIDRLGNSGTSASQPFLYTGTLDTTPNAFTLNTIIDALTNRIYGSNTITIVGLSANTQVLASINRGALYINDIYVGTTGYVQNDSTVKIELVSSNDYDTLVSSILTIGGVSATFRITTESETTTTTTTTSTSLSATAKMQIVAIFEALQDIYVGAKQSEFLNSFMVMLQSKMDDLGTSTADKNTRYALQYMYDLVDNYRGNIGTDVATIPDIVNGIYTAPNGKKYTITYDSTMKQFTSPNFLTPKYFATRDSFKYIIDINNPVGSSYLSAKAIKARRGKIRIDGTWQTSPYTAPNRKVFYFFKTMEGQYSSYTFTVEKYFDSLDAVKEFIHNSTSK